VVTETQIDGADRESETGHRHGKRPLFCPGYLLATYDRQELYTKVWNRPVRVVAKEYGISDVALAKTCRKLFIPHAWQRLLGEEGRRTAGSHPTKSPLHHGYLMASRFQAWCPRSPCFLHSKITPLTH